MFNEQNLIAKAKKGDKQALEKLYRDNVKPLYVFVRSKVNTNEQAEDICSESFTKAFEKLSTFKQNSSFKSWLYTIAKNIIFDWYKSKQIQVEFDDNQIEDKQAPEEVNTNKDYIKVKNLLSKLQDNYKEVLELRFLMNMNIQETSEAMKESKGNIKVIQNRAIKKAREILKELEK